MEDREGTNQRPQLEREDSTTALLSDSNREKESFPMACTKRTIFSAPEAGRSPRVIEASIVAFPPRKKEAAGQGEGERRSIFKRLSGSALCKMTVIVYIAGCVLVSALYVALYGGQSQKLFAASDAWIPGKPTQSPPKHPHPPTLPPLHFVDTPYTEWMSQRWTYYAENYSDWPALPPFVDRIQQVSSGKVGGAQGVWFLTESSLYFALNLDGSDPERVQFVNVSGDLEFDIFPDSQMAVDMSSSIFVATPYNVTLLDCAQAQKYSCSVAAQLSEESPIEWNEVVAAVVSVSDGLLWLGTDAGLFVAERDGTTITIRNTTSVAGTITKLAWRTSIADKPRRTRKRAFILDAEVTRLPRQYLAHSSVGGVHSTVEQPRRGTGKNSFGVLVVGTVERVYFYDGAMWWFEWVSGWYRGQGGTVDGSPSALSFTSTGELFIGNNVSLTRVNINYTYDRLGPLQGLPYNQIQSLHHSSYNPHNPPALLRSEGDYKPGTDGTLWVGTARGMALFDVSTSQFQHYFYGRRWHPGEAVLGFAASGGDATVVLTDGGIAVIYPQLWTLAAKAAHYQSMLDRHTRPPGLVADCSLTDYVPASCAPGTTDNDGLWTSIAVAAEAFRYQVTADPDAQINAWDLFLGMQFLNNVTGVRGLMARSVVTENETVNDGVWHNSTTEPGWKWKGDTSSDEVVGHMFAHPIVYDLVASSVEERSQAFELVDSIVGYIHNNSYYLIDVTNRSTRWGVWNPQPINFNYSWSDEHGINSLQIVTYLLSAHRITDRDEYLQAWKNLSADNGVYDGLATHYGRNLINQKITFPRDDNYSDDELAFLPYFIYFYTNKMYSRPGAMSELEAQVLEYVTLSLQRAWRSVGRERSALWTAIYAYAMDMAKDPDLTETVVWNLRTWPLELVEWNTTNSHRLDITFNPEQDRNFRSHSQSEKVLPANERMQLRWNGNPFLLDSGGSDGEMDPSPWLLPYWMARWMEML